MLLSTLLGDIRANLFRAITFAGGLKYVLQLAASLVDSQVDNAALLAD